MNEQNPILTYKRIPNFEAIKPSHFLGALDYLEDFTNTKIKAVSESTDLSWENIVQPICDARDKIGGSFKY